MVYSNNLFFSAKKMLYEYSNKGRKISLINEAIVRKEGDFLRANKIFLSEEIDEGNTYHYGEAYDNIYFYSSKDKVKIFGDYGYWNEKNNEVYISGRVKIKKKKMIIYIKKKYKLNKALI